MNKILEITKSPYSPFIIIGIIIVIMLIIKAINKGK